MPKHPCLECGSPTYSDVCESCWLQIRNATEKMWKQAGVDAADIASWVKAGFGPYSAPQWIAEGCGPVEAERLRAQRLGVTTSYSFEAAGFAGFEAEEWIEAEFTPQEAAKWAELGFDIDSAFEWWGVGFDSDEADAWLNEGFTVEEAEDWAFEGVGIPEAVEFRSQGLAPNDPAGWGETPFRDRAEWAAAAVDPVEANGWSVLIDRGIGGDTPPPTRSRFKPVAGLTMSEALSWSKNGFSSDRSDRGYFRPFRDAGLEPVEAKRYLAFLLETRVFAQRPFTLFDLTYNDMYFGDVEEDADRVRALASYEAAGIPWSAEIVDRWELMPAESILEAVDLGYEDAYEYENFASLGIPAEDVRRLSELTDDPDLVEGLWAAELAGIAADVAGPWISQGFEPSEIQDWIDAGLDSVNASSWTANDFTVDTAKRWIDGGIKDAFSAAAWRSVGLDPDGALGWTETRFEPDEARRWLLAGIEPDAAARRRAAGLQPPHA